MDGGHHYSPINLDLCFDAEKVVFPNTLLKASKGAACFGNADFDILCCNSGIIGDDDTKVSQSVHCVQLVSVDFDAWVGGRCHRGLSGT